MIADRRPRSVRGSSVRLLLLMWHPFLWAALMVVAMVAVTSRPAVGQQQSVAVPKGDYFLAFSFLYDGDFDRGARAFQSAARGGIRSTDGRWIDSICYATMMGECMYRKGELNLALEQYETALKLFLVHQNWMRQVEFPLAVEPSRRTLRRPVTWGSSQRQIVIGSIPNTVSISQALYSTLKIGKQTGVVATQQLFPIHAKEIVRCTTLALRRRREIMGPTCRYSPLTVQLLNALGRRPTAVNHWTQSWIDLQLGIVLASVGKDKEATAMLQRSVVVAGRFDHELTPMALMELGHLALQENKYDEAGKLFLEASISAGIFEQHDVVEEALNWGLKSHLAAGKRGLYAPLPLALQWSRTTSRMLEAGLYVAGAENYAVVGETAKATTMIQSAQQAMRRRDMSRGDLGARLTYASALVQFQQGNLAPGRKLLLQALAYQQKASARLLQLKLAHAIAVTGKTTTGVANELYAATLIPPTEKDWRLRPCDSLTYMMTPHQLPLQHWFEVQIRRKEPEAAFEIVDQLRRHRFTSNLELGGRLLALRWTLEAPREALSEDARTHRKLLEANYPKYVAHSIDSKAIRDKLMELPLIPAKDDAGQDHLELLTRLHKLSGIQEVMLREMALRPQPTESAFPPVCDVNQIRESLSEDEMVLSFYVTNQKIYALALRKTRSDHWVIGSSSKVQSELKDGLRQIGNIDKDAPVEFETVIAEAWKEPFTDLSSQLFADAPDALWDGVKRLVVVPDGFLWYLPFEMLPLKDGLIGSRYPVRYLPMLSLTAGDGREVQASGRTAVIETELIAGETEETGIAGTDQFKVRIPRLSHLPLPHIVPSNLIVANCNRLIVMSDVVGQGKRPFQWIPITQDRAKKGDPLEAWFALPWSSCDQVLLPAFHTAAEDAMRRGGTGNEIFFSVCGLMATGTRTILLTRWRTGSPTAYPLICEFTDRLTKQAPDQAWFESAEWFRNQPLDAEKEPRLKSPDAKLPTTMKHPFFWGGYMLIDSQRNGPAAAGDALNP